MMIREFLEFEIDQTPFLYEEDRCITRQAFVDEIRQLNHFLKQNLKTDAFVYLRLESPAALYTAIFSLWYTGNRAALPTKTSLEENHVPSYASHILTYQNNTWHISEHDGFSTHIPEGDIIVFSSGSTGTPKGIVHNKEHFLINAKATLAHLHITQVTSLCYLKPYLVSAISHMLVHWYSKSTLIFDHFENLHNLHAYSTISRRLNLVGSPIHIISAQKYLKKISCTPDFFFTSGDMISDVHIENILTSFPKVTFFKVYGLAEVAGRLYIKTITNDTLTFDMGTPISCASTRIIDHEVVVSSNILFLGYIINDQYIPRSEPFFTGDLTEKLPTGEYVLKGRKNDEVKVAGNKVSVKYLENRIASSLKVMQLDFIALVAVPHDFFGNTLSLVISDNTSLNKNEIISLLRKTINPHQMPHSYYRINTDNIPFTQSMKIDRASLVDMIKHQKLEPIS